MPSFGDKSNILKVIHEEDFSIWFILRSFFYLSDYGKAKGVLWKNRIRCQCSETRNTDLRLEKWKPDETKGNKQNQKVNSGKQATSVCPIIDAPCAAYWPRFRVHLASTHKKIMRICGIQFRLLFASYKDFFLSAEIRRGLDLAVSGSVYAYVYVSGTVHVDGNVVISSVCAGVSDLFLLPGTTLPRWPIQPPFSNHFSLPARMHASHIMRLINNKTAAAEANATCALAPSCKIHAPSALLLPLLPLRGGSFHSHKQIWVAVWLSVSVCVRLLQEVWENFRNFFF